jgi:hypothetical protein
MCHQDSSNHNLYVPPRFKQQQWQQRQQQPQQRHGETDNQPRSKPVIKRIAVLATWLSNSDDK